MNTLNFEAYIGYRENATNDKTRHTTKKNDEPKNKLLTKINEKYKSKVTKRMHSLPIPYDYVVTSSGVMAGKRSQSPIRSQRGMVKWSGMDSVCLHSNWNTHLDLASTTTKIRQTIFILFLFNFNSRDDRFRCRLHYVQRETHTHKHTKRALLNTLCWISFLLFFPSFY